MTDAEGLQAFVELADQARARRQYEHRKPRFDGGADNRRNDVRFP